MKMKQTKEGCGKIYERADGTFPRCSLIQGLCPKCKKKEQEEEPKSKKKT